MSGKRLFRFLMRFTVAVWHFETTWRTYCLYLKIIEFSQYRTVDITYWLYQLKFNWSANGFCSKVIRSGSITLSLNVGGKKNCIPSIGTLFDNSMVRFLYINNLGILITIIKHIMTPISLIVNCQSTEESIL